MKYVYLILALIIIFFLSLFVSQSKASELYVYGGIGQASSSVTNVIGLWKHDGQPYEFDGKTMGFRAGLGYGQTLGVIDAPIPLTHGFRLELGAVSLGSPEVVKAWTNADDAYDSRGQCYRTCDQLHQFNVVDDYLGAELVGKYGLTAFDFLEVYTTAGIAGFSHRLSGTHIRPDQSVEFFDSHHGEYATAYRGMVLAGVIGGGVCGNVYPAMDIRLCGDVEKFLPFVQTGNPLVASGVDGPVLTTFQMIVPIKTF